MAAPQFEFHGRDFTAEELIGRQIRIEGPVPDKHVPPAGYAMRVIADGEVVTNVFKFVLTIATDCVVEAILTLSHDGMEEDEEITLRDNIELSFSAFVSEVR